MTKKYTLELKEEAVKLVTEKGYNQTEAARILGTSDKNINRWVNKLAAKNTNSKNTASDKEEIKRLRKENERLKIEREILKKAAAFFAKEQS